MPVPRSFQQELVGVFGWPVAENPTQAMIEPAFAAMGLDWRYLTVAVRPEQLGDAVRGARAMQWKGFNCTIPHKVAVISLLDRLTPVAEAIGAVNCAFVDSDGQLVGDNTDGKGFLQSVAAVRPVPGSAAVILGAGGAARAISVELAFAGARQLTVVNRNPERGQALARHVQERTGVPATFVKWEAEYPISDGTDILVNATSIGLFPDVDATVSVVVETLRPGLLVCDVIPNPPRTRLIVEAEARGCKTLDGLGMLVNQGVIGIQRWTGRDADPAVMRAALEAVFAPL